MIRYISEILHGVVSSAKGMWVTFKNMFHPTITVPYPEKKQTPALRFRGRLVLPVDPEKNENRCTACMMCVKICPNHSIDVDKKTDETGKPLPKAAKYIYNLGSCMFCNLCVEVCPFFAIVMSDEYELATEDRGSLKPDLVAENYQLKGRKAKWWQSKFKDEE